MADSFVILPTDVSNIGKKVRTQTRTVGGETVHEHYNILQDQTNDYQASIDSTGALKTFDAVANSFVPAVYDYMALTYTDSDLTQVVYKTGGSGGSVVATLTITYTAHVLQTITKS